MMARDIWVKKRVVSHKVMRASVVGYIKDIKAIEVEDKGDSVLDWAIWALFGKLDWIFLSYLNTHSLPRLIIYSIYLIWSCIGVLELHQLFGVWSGFGGQIHSTPIQQDHWTQRAKLSSSYTKQRALANPPLSSSTFRQSSNFLATTVSPWTLYAVFCLLRKHFAINSPQCSPRPPPSASMAL